MGYQKIYVDLEDFANELVVHKAKQVFFRISFEQTPTEEVARTKLEDGTISEEKKRGIKCVANISFSALGFSTPVEVEKSKPDTLLGCVLQLYEKTCFKEEDIKEFNAEVDKAWKATINDLKRIWGGAIFEGVVSLT